MLRIDDIPQQVADDIQGCALIYLQKCGTIYIHSSIFLLKTDSFINQIPIYCTFVFCLQTIKMNLSLNLNPFFAKKVNPFSIKSEPILQNEPIRILYPFRSPFTKKAEYHFSVVLDG